MSEAPKPDEHGNDWMNRIIVLVISLFCVVFGLPLAVGSALSFTTMVVSLEWPNPWTIVSFGIGMTLCGFGVVIGWSAIRPKKATK